MIEPHTTRDVIATATAKVLAEYEPADETQYCESEKGPGAMSTPKETPVVNGLPIPTWSPYFQKTNGRWWFVVGDYEGHCSHLGLCLEVPTTQRRKLVVDFYRPIIAAVAEVAWRERADHPPLKNGKHDYADRSKPCQTCLAIKEANCAVTACREWGKETP